MSLRQAAADDMTITPELFDATATATPLSFWGTYGGAAAQAFNETSIGTLGREAATPDLAKTPVAGGRGGVMWRDETPQEVQARGDTLYQTEDDYKKSDNYRPDVPFEKGMTANRAKALADQYDRAQMRAYFGSKRPVANFLGGLTGAALDPVNYIPIAGEASAAWATARFGKFAGRVLTGAADAGLNTLGSQIATAPIRQQFGDDVSWNAILTNAAFAAMAGAAIHGIAGTVSHFRGMGEDIKPTVEPGQIAPERIAPEMARGPDVSYGGEVKASFGPHAVVTRLDTLGNRLKAADAMNDAVFGLSTEGEVRLGERAQMHLAGLQDEAIAKAARLAQIEAQKPASWVIREKETGKVVMETFDQKKVDALNTAKYEAVPIHDHLASINTPEKRAASVPKETIKATPEPLATSTTTTATFGSETRVPSEAIWQRQNIAGSSQSFHVPAPEPQPPFLKAAYSSIDALAKPKAEGAGFGAEGAAVSKDPEIAAAVKSAKAEGFDPETGKHDLEDDLQILREREALTPEDEEALKAADETFKGAEAYSDALSKFLACDLK